MKFKKWVTAGIACVAAIGLLAGCSATGSSSGSKVTIDLWTPQAGSPKVEVQNMQKMIDDFTKANPQYKFNYKQYPFDSYATSVQGAAAANKLPCMLAVDAPTAPNWAWAGWLKPLNLPKSLTDKLIPGAKGTYKGTIYSAGYWDAGLAMFARKSVLEKAGIRIPTVDKPWTESEFSGVLAKLKQDPTWKYPLSLGNPDIYSGTPFLWSFGGDLIDRKTYLSSDGVLNGDKSVAYFKWVQDLINNKDISVAPTDGNPFESGQVPLYWDGNWDAQSSFTKFGSDTLFLPAPDFGNGTKVGAGSFGYGTSSSCSKDQAEGVNKFLEFSMTTKNFTNIADTQLVIPATADAAAKSKYYGPGGQFETFAKLEANHSEIRPATPAFSVIADIYNKASKDIFAGADAQKTLDQAVKDIDADIKSNQGYGFNK